MHWLLISLVLIILVVDTPIYRRHILRRHQDDLELYKNIVRRRWEMWLLITLIIPFPILLLASGSNKENEINSIAIFVTIFACAIFWYWAAVYWIVRRHIKKTKSASTSPATCEIENESHDTLK